MDGQSAFIFLVGVVGVGALAFVMFNLVRAGRPVRFSTYEWLALLISIGATIGLILWFTR